LLVFVFNFSSCFLLYGPCRNHYNGGRWYRACSWDTCNHLYTGACAHGIDVAVNRRNSPKFWFHWKSILICSLVLLMKKICLFSEIYCNRVTVCSFRFPNHVSLACKLNWHNLALHRDRTRCPHPFCYYWDQQIGTKDLCFCVCCVGHK